MPAFKFQSFQKKNGLKRLWKLKPSNKLCSDFYVLDIETGRRKKCPITGKPFVYWCLDARPERFIFAVIYGYNFQKVVYSVEEMKAELLLPRYKGKKVFAHNGGGYDYIGIYGNIYNIDPKAIFNGKFICFTNGNCMFADSMNIFVGASVKVIGKMMGLFKGTLGDNNYRSKDVFPKKGIFEITTKDNKDVLYCLRDCRIIWEALFSVFEFAGAIKITQASLSMCYFRTFHMPFHIDHNENTKFFWQSYYGGRCEAFKMGKTYATVIDANQMYPFHMKNLRFPNPKILKHEKNMSVKLFKKYLYWYEGCAEVSVIHKHTTFGFLPFKKDGKLLFPVGNLTGCWNFNELRFALEKGAIEILKVKRVIYSEPMESPFISFVDTLTKMKAEAKQTGNLFEEDRAKRFVNSLYGKFAQRIIEESIYLDDIEKNWDLIVEHQKNGTFLKLDVFNKNRNDAFLVVKASKKMDVSYAIPSFASYITSGARIHLLEKMLELENKKIVYCDTDSIFFEINDGTIKNEFHLGGWKVENKVITKIIGLKNYKYIDIEKSSNEIWRVKGVPVIKNDPTTGKPYRTKIFNDDGTEEEVQTVEQVGENKFVYYNLIKTKEGLKRKKEPGVITKRIKEIKNTYDKRIILFNGETKPIEI